MRTLDSYRLFGLNSSPFEIPREFLSGLEEPMYAIIETGGKQFRVAANDTITVEKLDAKTGDKLSIDKVLLVADGDAVTVGKPTVGGAKVQATVVSQKRGTRVRAEKFKRRTGEYHRHGHRQYLTTLKIETISLA
jgi:large subunit ribosomal protein L21